MPSTVNTTTFELRNPAGVPIAGISVPGGETPTATLTPSAPLAPGDDLHGRPSRAGRQA